MGGYASAVGRFKPNSNIHIFTVSRASGSKLTEFPPPSVPSMQVKVFSTIKENKPLQIDYQKSLFKGQKVGGGSRIQTMIRCLSPLLQPNLLSKKIMGMYGFEIPRRRSSARFSPLLRSIRWNNWSRLPAQHRDRSSPAGSIWPCLENGDQHFYSGGSKLRQYPRDFGQDGIAGGSGPSEDHGSNGCGLGNGAAVCYWRAAQRSR